MTRKGPAPYPSGRGQQLNFLEKSVRVTSPITVLFGAIAHIGFPGCVLAAMLMLTVPILWTPLVAITVTM